MWCLFKNTIRGHRCCSSFSAGIMCPYFLWCKTTRANVFWTLSACLSSTLTFQWEEHCSSQGRNQSHCRLWFWQLHQTMTHSYVARPRCDDSTICKCCWCAGWMTASGRGWLKGFECSIQVEWQLRHKYGSNVIDFVTVLYGFPCGLAFMYWWCSCSTVCASLLSKSLSHPGPSVRGVSWNDGESTCLPVTYSSTLMKHQAQ